MGLKEERPDMNFLIERRERLSKIGHNLSVEVYLSPGDSRRIQGVSVVLDSILLNPHHAGRHHLVSRYVREFQDVGKLLPGLKHKLLVQVTLSDGTQASSTLHWRDTEVVEE